MSQLMSRDAFAREELHRCRIYYPSYSFAAARGCWNCGQIKMSQRKKLLYLFRYWIEPDSVTPRKFEIKGEFCCQACFREYQGIH